MVKTAFGDVKAFPNGSIVLKGHPFNGHPYLVNGVTTLKFGVYVRTLQGLKRTIYNYIFGNFLNTVFVYVIIFNV